MIDQEKIATAFDAAALRSAERRRFLSLVGRGGVAAGGLALLSACGGGDSTSEPTPTPSATSTESTEAADISILNFALNLEYLSAQYFSYAAQGAGLPAADTSGTGTAGAVAGGAQVAFADPIVAACAREIARDDKAHVEYLRAQLGEAAVAMPSIDISNAFAAFGLGSFDPYASDENFLYGAFILKDVIVTAYKGLAPLVATSAWLAGTAGILGAESYHAGLIRTLLYQKGLAANAGKISDARDGLDGSTDLDQGIAGANASISNIAPVDGNGVTYSRTTGQVLNILFQTSAGATRGGFYPNGLNGTVNASAAGA